MVKIYGKLPERKKRDLVIGLSSMVSATARMQAELEEGQGPHLLAERLRGMGLPDGVSIILRPTLAFLHADICLIGGGKVLVINALHWSGEIGRGKKGEWTGAKGAVDLGRPDRRAYLFCDRLRYSGLADGFAVEPVVVFTAGPVRCHEPEPQATLVQWAELEAFLRRSLAGPEAGPSPAGLIETLTSA
ncbi:MAG: nuclease-related domain-containing protein [Bacillota bacterium]